MGILYMVTIPCSHRECKQNLKGRVLALSGRLNDRGGVSVKRMVKVTVLEKCYPELQQAYGVVYSTEAGEDTRGFLRILKELLPQVT